MTEMNKSVKKVSDTNRNVVKSNRKANKTIEFNKSNKNISNQKKLIK